MATNYPGSLDTSTQQPTIASSDEMDDSGKEHDVVHTNHSGAIIAFEPSSYSNVIQELLVLSPTVITGINMSGSNLVRSFSVLFQMS